MSRALRTGSVICQRQAASDVKLVYTALNVNPCLFVQMEARQYDPTAEASAGGSACASESSADLIIQERLADKICHLRRQAQQLVRTCLTFNRQ